MKPETISSIHEATLAAKELLLKEMSEQLEGIYGFLPSGVLKERKEYPTLSLIADADETRRRLEVHVADEKYAGIGEEQCRQKLVNEAAFTWLNRLVAFKLLETRKLIRQTIAKIQDSNGFKMWLTTAGNEVNLRDYESGDLPQDGLGEGPRHRSYRKFLLAQCSILSSEVLVLFDNDNLASRLCPRPPILRKLIELLNSEELKEAWEPGNEDSIGWVYQFFIEDQKKLVFEKLFKKKQKIVAADIPAATQIFTPRWIVQFLVENTLGRMWLQMHPDSALEEKMTYLVPQHGLPLVKAKLAKEIRLLDPACGTMHFGLVAFDLLTEMYREEIEKSGQHGWLQTPSVSTIDQIPSAILSENIHGIDIDLRAVQLSALSLFIRAKSFNPQANIRNSRLACADIHMMNGEKLKDFLQLSSLGQEPIYGRILDTLYRKLKDVNQLGSLLRINEDVKSLVEEERKKLQGNNQQLSIFETSNSVEQPVLDRDFWDRLETQVVEAINEFAKRRAGEGVDQGFFTAEASKGMRLLDIMGQTYDIVLANPPYMSRRNMSVVLQQHLQKEFPIAKADLYAAFIQRCTEWLAEGGRLGMITQQSFMFTTVYDKLREYLRDRLAIETVPHVGPRAFEEISGEKVNTTLLVMRRTTVSAERNSAHGSYFRLVKEVDNEAKHKRLLQSLVNLREGLLDSIVFRYQQKDFDDIAGSPWVYWITPTLRALFSSRAPLTSISRPWVGLQTSDNKRFLRYWWEIGHKNIAHKCTNAASFAETGKRWAPYMKGGKAQRWYGNQDCVVNWENNGSEMKAFAEQMKANGESTRGNGPSRDFQYYFRRGITFPNITSGRFSARLSPGGFMFDVSGSSIFPDRPELILGVLNSSFANYALKLMNPTVNTQVGDVARVPMPEEISEQLIHLVAEAIELVRKRDQQNECSYDFVSPLNWTTGVEEAQKQNQLLLSIEQKIDEEVYRLYGISEADRTAIESELADPMPIDDDDSDQDEDDEEDELDSVLLTQSELGKRWISYAVGIVMGRFVPGVDTELGFGHFDKKTAEALVSLADSDGIVVLDENHPDDLANKVMQVLRTSLGDEAAISVVSESLGPSGYANQILREYFNGQFFKDLLSEKRYRRRPIYWLLQSPKKKYTVLIYHEKFSRDSLFRIQGEQYLEAKFNLLQAELSELKKKKEMAAGKARRQIEKDVEVKEDLLNDIREFSKRIERITETGYSPNLNDGILINMAPLWELIPAWQSELKKVWESLEKGDLDWSYQARHLRRAK